MYNRFAAGDALHKLALRGGLRTSAPVLVWLYDILSARLFGCLLFAVAVDSMLCSGSLCAC